MSYFWRIGFTFIIVISSISHAFDDLDLESENQKSENNINELAFSQNAPDFEATQASLTQLQDTMTAKTQNPWTNVGEDISQDSLTTETDPSQHEIIADEIGTPDISQASCSSTTPVNNALNGNTGILPRGKACSAEIPPLVKPIPRPQTVKPVSPAIKLKPPTKPAPVAKPVRRLRIPDENNPCATESKTRQTLVTCQGPQIGYTDQDADNLAYVIGCNGGRSPKHINEHLDRH